LVIRASIVMRSEKEPRPVNGANEGALENAQPNRRSTPHAVLAADAAWRPVPRVGCPSKGTDGGSLPTLHHRTRCVGCGACDGACRFNAIAMLEGAPSRVPRFESGQGETDPIHGDVAVKRWLRGQGQRG
jgi:ferredoxin